MTERVSFSVDVHLLTELGERLVGRPAIALGELVKNSYDADATVVKIVVDSRAITVTDNGHGMSYEALKTRFLRVGTPIKEQERLSPGFDRRLTGSKGVGRLAVQMLGRRLIVETRSLEEPDELHRLQINWDDKVDGEDISTFTASLERPTSSYFLGDGPGTVIRIEELRTDWTTEEVEALARDIWMLRSPFPGNSEDSFSIEFESEDQGVEQAFERVLKGWIGLYEANVKGEFHAHAKVDCRDIQTDLTGPHVHLNLKFQDEERTRRTVVAATSSALGLATYDINIYLLRGRQELGLSVGDVRDYLNEIGGVYLYDDGFRLPYYGPDTDWLGIEMDHSHRRTVSRVLPKDLQAPGGLSFLPTTSRIFGAVHVSTSFERDRVTAGEVDEAHSLQIQISRDRLLDTPAFSTLHDAVRVGLDWYAHEKRRKQLLLAENRLRVQQEQSKGKASAIEVLDTVAGELSEQSFQLLQSAILADTHIYASQIEVQERRSAALGALATAGMVSLLLEHEYARLVPQLHAFADQHEGSSDPQIRTIAHEVRAFADQLETLSPMLRSLMEPENRKAARLSARRVVANAITTLGTLLKGIEIENDVDQSVLLPSGSLAEWSALFENVILNAANATIGTDTPKVRIHARGGERTVRVLDNGHGIDLDAAESYFEPFVRGPQAIPPERRALGMGGTGLGLTIVRTIAEALGAEAMFTKPSRRGWSTCFVLKW